MNRCSQTPLKARMPAGQRGAAVVEFALILPILLVLLVGTVDASLALYDKAVITNASREGARVGIVARNPPLSAEEIKLYVKSVVNQYVEGSLVSFHGNEKSPEVSVKIGNFAGDPTVQVTVTYNFQGVFLGGLFDSLGKELKLESSTVMVME